MFCYSCESVWEHNWVCFCKPVVLNLWVMTSTKGLLISYPASQIFAFITVHNSSNITVMKWQWKESYDGVATGVALKGSGAGRLRALM